MNTVAYSNGVDTRRGYKQQGEDEEERHAAGLTLPSGWVADADTHPDSDTKDQSSSMRKERIESEPTISPKWSIVADDHLEVISSFLSLRELSVGSCVCTEWRAMIGRLAPRNESVHCDYATIIRIAESTYLRHITQLILLDDTSTVVRLTPLEMSIMRMSMPRLQHLKCGIKLITGAHNPAVSFPSVKGLDVCLVADIGESRLDECWCILRPWLSAIGAIPALTQLTLTIDNTPMSGGLLPPLPLMNMPDNALEPLLPLSNRLTALHLSCKIPGVNLNAAWSTAQLRVIRQFTHLTSLRIARSGWSARELNDLLFESSVPPLSDLDLRHTVIEEAMSIPLARATDFSRFEPMAIGLHDASFIAAYKRLESCSLICTPSVDVELLIAAVATCTRIHTLALRHANVTDEQLEVLLSPLTKLTSLGLYTMNSMTQLVFASRLPHLASTLTHLGLHYCSQIAADELIHLRSLRALESLYIDRSFSSQLYSATIASLTPATAEFDAESQSIWPKLRRFIYYQP